MGSPLPIKNSGGWVCHVTVLLKGETPFPRTGCLPAGRQGGGKENISRAKNTKSEAEGRAEEARGAKRSGLPFKRSSNFFVKVDQFS